MMLTFPTLCYITGCGWWAGVSGFANAPASARVRRPRADVAPWHSTKRATQRLRKQDRLLQQLPHVPHLQSAWLLLLYCAAPRCTYYLPTGRGPCRPPTRQTSLPSMMLRSCAASRSCWPGGGGEMPSPTLAPVEPAPPQLGGLGLGCEKATPATSPTAALRPARHDPGGFGRQGWQHAATTATDKRVLETLLSELDRTSRALLLNQAGETASCTIPTTSETRVPDEEYRVMLLRTPRWRLGRL